MSLKTKGPTKFGDFEIDALGDKKLGFSQNNPDSSIRRKNYAS